MFEALRTSLIAMGKAICPTYARAGTACLMLAAVTVLFFWPLLRGDTFIDVASRQAQIYPGNGILSMVPPTIHYDQEASFYPWQVFINRALRNGELPLWNPDSFAGQPFFATSMSGILYPPRLLFSLLARPHRVHDWLVFTHMLLGGLTMYLLLISLRLCFVSALFGAIAWMVNSFMLGWMALEHFLVIEAWLPLAFLLLPCVLQRRSRLASLSLGVVWALIFLGGNLLFTEISFVVWGAYGTCLLWPRWRSEWQHGSRQSAARLALADCRSLAVPMLLFAGLIAVQLLPTLSLMRSMARAPLGYNKLLNSRLPVAALLRFFFFIPLNELGSNDAYHSMLFLGTPTALLALGGGIACSQPTAKYARWLGFTVLLAALGTPVTWALFWLLPGFAYLNPLGRVLFLFNFAVAILAAYGLDRLLLHTRRGVGRLTFWLALAVFVLAVGGPVIWTVRTPMSLLTWVPFQLGGAGWFLTGCVAIFLLAVGPAALWEGPKRLLRREAWEGRRRRYLALCLLVAVLFGIAIVWRFYYAAAGQAVPLLSFQTLELTAQGLLSLDHGLTALTAVGLVALTLSGLLLRIPKLPRLRLAYLLTVIVVLQMLQVGAQVMRHQPLLGRDRLFPDTGLVKALKQDGVERVLPIVPLFYGSGAMVFGLQNVGGYESLLPERIRQFWRVVEGQEPAKAMLEVPTLAYISNFRAAKLRSYLLPRLSVTHVASIQGPDSLCPQYLKDRRCELPAGPWQLTYLSVDGVAARVTAPMPRAYLVPQHEQAATPLRALQRFTEAGFDPSQAVVIEVAKLAEAGIGERPAKCRLEDGGRVQIMERRLNSMTIKFNAACDAWLVVNEVWNEGWQAAIDGHPVSVLPGNFVFRTLPVPAGEHVVELRYRPISLVIGSVITGATLMVLLGAVLFLLTARLRTWLKPAHTPEVIEPAAEKVEDEHELN